MSGLLAQVLAQVKAALGPVLGSSLQPQSALSRIFDLLGNVILAEVQEALAANVPGEQASARMGRTRFAGLLQGMGMRAWGCGGLG